MVIEDHNEAYCLLSPIVEETKVPSLRGALAHAHPLVPAHREEPGPLETGGFIDADGGRKGPPRAWGLSQSADA